MSEKPLSERVAARYAATVLDDKMKALLLKLRKGASASLSVPMLFKVLSLLGGWNVEKYVGLVKLHGYGGSKDDEPKLLAEENEERARQEYERLKAHVVTSLPSHPKLGEIYVMDLEPLKSWENFKRMLHGTNYRLWEGVEGYKVTDPNGKIFEFLPNRFDVERYSSNPKALLKTLGTHQIMPWLVKQTPWYAQINELLGMEEHVPAAARTRDNTGTCAVCFRNIKLVTKGDNKTMALHGYNRPGFGYVVGRCWGGDHAPYELSCEATKLILNKVGEEVDGLKAYLKGLSDPNLAEFDEHKWWRTPNAKILRKSETSPVVWEYSLKDHIKSTEHQVAMAEMQFKLYEWLIHNWKLRELPTEGSKHIDWFEEAVKAIRYKADE